MKIKIKSENLKIWPVIPRPVLPGSSWLGILEASLHPRRDGLLVLVIYLSDIEQCDFSNNAGVVYLRY